MQNRSPAAAPVSDHARVTLHTNGMKSSLDAVKRDFREGRHGAAIAACEILCERDPGDRAARRVLGMMFALTKDYARARAILRELHAADPADAELLFNIGMCERELQDFEAARASFGTYTRRFPADPGGWAGMAEAAFGLDDFQAGIDAAQRAIALDASLVPVLAQSRIARGESREREGRLEAAAADYRAALALTPADAGALRKATICLLEANRGEEAIALCREVLRKDPGNLTAKLGADWLLTKLVPLWHIPMMNEHERNDAFHRGLQAAVKTGDTVFEIGTGSGLLAMMTARLGASRVVTCEAVSLIASTAAAIVRRNGLDDRVKVLAKPSQEVVVGEDLPAKADVLVHEIFSSELLGENVLPAIEDAKARLLRPGGRILPSAGSIMVALVSGDELERNLYVNEAFGFDLRDFNAIHPKRRPLYREDLAPVLLSEPLEAFRFDFASRLSFPAERKQIRLKATQGGRCLGLIQWMRIELAPGILYENRPGRPQAVSNWQHTIYGLEAPREIVAGEVVAFDASHDRTRPWFEAVVAR